MTTSARCRNVALAAFYTFLLGLGAVAPFAASYSRGAHAQPEESPESGALPTTADDLSEGPCGEAARAPS